MDRERMMEGSSSMAHHYQNWRPGTTNGRTLTDDVMQEIVRAQRQWKLEAKYISERRREAEAKQHLLMMGSTREKWEAERMKRQRVLEEMEEMRRQEMNIETAKRVRILKEELKEVNASLADTRARMRFLVKEMRGRANNVERQLPEANLPARQAMLQVLGDMVETELQCVICQQLFTKATILNCSHTFCYECISNWKKERKDCPICRAPIETESRCLSLDTFIDMYVKFTQSN